MKNSTVFTGICGNIYCNFVLLKNTIHPANISAVFIPSPDLLSYFIDQPSGVTLLLGHCATDWHLLLLLQHQHLVNLALFCHKALIFHLIISYIAYSRSDEAINIGNHITCDPCDRDTDLLPNLPTHLVHLIPAKGLVGHIVLHIKIVRGINTVASVSVFMGIRVSMM